MTEESTGHVQVVICVHLGPAYYQIVEKCHYFNTPPQQASSPRPIPSILHSSLWCRAWKAFLKTSVALRVCALEL